MYGVFIEGRRDGYTPSQCGDTLTVGQLIAMLEGFDTDSQVYLDNDNGYTFGSIDDCSFEERLIDEEE